MTDYALPYSRHAMQHFTVQTRRRSANNMLPHILHCDTSTWMSFFIESRLWEFEIVPAFAQGTSIRRCDNEYALQVFHHLAEHNPQVDNISYRIFNTTPGPIRIQQPLQQPAGAASPAYSTTHFTHHGLVEITFQPFTARALMTTCHDLRINTFSFLHNRQLMHAISARAQRLTQDLTFRMPDELRQILLQRRTCIRSLSYCTYTSFANTSTQHFSVSILGHSVQSHRIAPASAAQQKLPVPRIATTLMLHAVLSFAACAVSHHPQPLSYRG